jgi:hypothetical protein
MFSFLVRLLLDKGYQELDTKKKRKREKGNRKIGKSLLWASASQVVLYRSPHTHR